VAIWLDESSTLGGGGAVQGWILVSLYLRGTSHGFHPFEVDTFVVNTCVFLQLQRVLTYHVPVTRWVTSLLDRHSWTLALPMRWLVCATLKGDAWSWFPDVPQRLWLLQLETIGWRSHSRALHFFNHDFATFLVLWRELSLVVNLDVDYVLLIFRWHLSSFESVGVWLLVLLLWQVLHFFFLWLLRELCEVVGFVHLVRKSKATALLLLIICQWTLLNITVQVFQ
jgi:hypothetical protein